MLCNLAKETLRDLYAFRQTALYPPRAVLFVEGETPRGLFVLCTGKAKASATSKEGRRVTLRLVEPGEAVGLSNVIANCPYQAAAETMAPSQICFFPRAEFLRFLQTKGDFAVRIAEYLCKELHQAWEQTRLLTLAPSARAKLAQLLVDNARLHGQNSPGGVRMFLNLTEEEVGETIGVTRETVCRLLADFRRLQLIRMKGRGLTLLKPDQLRLLGSS
jgi:CRP/FNR family transcriptional regulator